MAHGMGPGDHTEKISREVAFAFLEAHNSCLRGRGSGPVDGCRLWAEGGVFRTETKWNPSSLHLFGF